MKRVEIWSNGKLFSSSKNLAGIRRMAGKELFTNAIRIRLLPRESDCDALLDIRFEDFAGKIYTADSIEWADRTVLGPWINRWRNVRGVNVEIIDSEGNVSRSIAGRVPTLPHEK